MNLLKYLSYVANSRRETALSDNSLCECRMGANTNQTLSDPIASQQAWLRAEVSKCGDGGSNLDRQRSKSPESTDIEKGLKELE